MRQSWGLNAISSHQQPSHISHISQQSPSQQSQQHQSHCSSPVSVQQIQIDDRRRQGVSMTIDHEKVYSEREVEKERERVRDINERERDRLRHYYSAQSGANLNVAVRKL